MCIRDRRNAVVQGAAAALFKAWSATVRAGLAGLDARIVLCLPAGRPGACPAEIAADVVAVVESSLQRTAAWWCAGSGVRFVAETSVAESWADTK